MGDTKDGVIVLKTARMGAGRLESILFAILLMCKAFFKVSYSRVLVFTHCSIPGQYRGRIAQEIRPVKG